MEMESDLKNDPRMLADKVHLATLPVDPVAQKIEWEVVRNQKNEVIGVHSLSNGTPTLFAKLFLLQSGEKYSNWKFMAE